MIAGRYRLVRRLARGGMGSVWQAVHVDLHLDVALKFIRTDAHDLAAAAERFRREARLLAQLKSPHIVQVLDFGFDAKAPYIAMEFLRGQDLGFMLDRTRVLAPRDCFPLIFEAARGLWVAHRAGVIHRDIKPSNLFATEAEDGYRIKLIDFGIAKERHLSSQDTTQGMILGSPVYMSPEQARGSRLDESTDVWSLAAVAYRMLTGRPPIEGENPNDTVVRICTESPRRPSELRPELGTGFDDLFAAAFSREREGRLRSLPDFVEAFREAVRASGGDAAVAHLEEPFVSRGRASDAAVAPAAVWIGRKEETASLAQSPMEGAARGADPGSDGTASVSVAKNARLSSSGAENDRHSSAGRRSRWLAWVLAAAALVYALGSWTFPASMGHAAKLPPPRPPTQEHHEDSAPPTPISPTSAHAVARTDTAERKAEPAPPRPASERPRAPQRSPLKDDFSTVQLPRTASRRPKEPTNDAAKEASRRPSSDVSSSPPTAHAPAANVPPTDPVFGLPLTDP